MSTQNKVIPVKPAGSAWLRALRAARAEGRCVELTEPAPWGRGVALALAPHPDDTEAIAVTLRLLAAQGWDLHWAVVTSGWSGVLDSFVGPERGAKARARREEQRAAARLFGLAADRLQFLELEEEDSGALRASGPNRERLLAMLEGLEPDLVLLPWRRDSNATHRLVYQWFSEWAAAADHLVVALGNEDPKTLDFQAQARVSFDEASAQWKGRLLECHQSQSVRNQLQRGHNFAERILVVNRAAGAGVGAGAYAERFQVDAWEPLNSWP